MVTKGQIRRMRRKVRRLQVKVGKARKLNTKLKEAKNAGR